MTAGDLINGSLKLIGVLGAGETADSNDAADALARLNDLLDLLATHRLTVYNQERSVYSLVAGTRDYTIGSGATFNQARPVWIDAIGLVVNGFEYPMHPLTDGEWQRWADKTTQAQPSAYYFNDTYANGELSFLAVPDSANSYEVAVYWPSSSVTSVASLATTLSVPPGWALMLRYNLAVLLAPEFGASLRPEIADMAAKSLGDVKRSNIRAEVLTFDPALSGRRRVVSRSDFNGGSF